MSRRPRQVVSPNLFPFLAVLVCTMGTLILLLALVAQDAEESAQQVAASEAKSAVIRTDDHRWRAEELEKLRARHTSALEQRRSQLAHLEDHLRRIREQLAELAAEAKAAENASDASTDQAKAHLVSLRSRIDEEQKKLETLQQEQATRPPRVVIVPYQGTNGTDRRPIYVECTDQAVILQPEGVRITAAHLEGPLGPGNPLDAALRAIRDHWQQTDPSSPPPYPLLLVRPGGVHAYAACRTAMTAWDDQFGYELISDDMRLAFPDPDAELRGKLVQTIDEAAHRQRVKVAAMPGRYPSLSREAIAASDAAGGSSQAAARRGTSGGGSRSGSSGAPGGAPRDSNTDSADGEPLPFTGDHSGFASGSEADWNLSPAGSGSLGGSSGPLGGAPASGDGEPRSPGLASRGSSSGSTPGIGQRGTAATLQGPANARDPENAQDLEIALAPGGTSAPGGTGLFDSITSGGEPTGQGSAEAESALPSGSPADGSLPPGDGGSSGDAGPPGKIAADTPNPLGSGGGTEGSGQTSGGGGGGKGAEGPGNGLSASSMGAASPSMSTPPPSEPFDPHAKTFSEAAPTFQSSSASRNPSSADGSPPVLRAGNDWAMPDAIRNSRGTAIVRHMRMRCEAERYVLLPENRNSGAMTIIAITGGESDDAVLELATALRDRVESWGLAMQNGRWEPILSVQVEAGAETRFAELQQLLRGSGIRVERETGK